MNDLVHSLDPAAIRDAHRDHKRTRWQEPLSDSLFATVFRDSPDGIVVVDAASAAIVDANRAVRHHLGFEPAALIGRAFARLDAQRGADGAILDAVRAHGAFSAERELRRIDESLCLMHVRAATASWSAREVVIVTLRDVRDRKRADAARQQAEERFRDIVDNAIEGIFQTTADGTYLSANPALARMYGYDTPAELIVQLTDIAGQLYIDAWRRAEFRRLLEAQDVVHGFESQIRRRDGAIIWISENARAVRDPAGALRYYEGTVIDITARKAAEAARRDEAAVAAALADFGREMMASIDSPEILTRLCQLSLAALGCDWAHTLLWESVRDQYVPVSSAGAPPTPPIALPRSALAGLLSALERDGVLVVDTGTAAALPASLQPLQDGCAAALYFAVRRAGVCVGLLMVGCRARAEPFSDVQRRIARGIANLASVALEHARVLDELARANRVKSEFLATMSHELRTPLHIILGYNDLLRERQFGTLTQEQADMVERVGHSAGELLELINATLDLSRLEAGRLPMDVGDVALPALFGRLDQESRELLRGKPQVALAWDVATDLPVLHTDAGKLKVVLKNLIHNAVKFTDSGAITIRARRGQCGVEISVNDTGIGIPPDAMSLIFEPFRQVDGSPTRRHGGVGLGLHVVRRLIELLGGTVEVESQPGHGSTFRIQLPA